MLTVKRIESSNYCGACTFWLDNMDKKHEKRQSFEVKFGYDGVNHTQSFNLCSVCLAELSEKIRNILNAEYNTVSPVILVLQEYLKNNPDQGGFEIEKDRKADVKLWLDENGYKSEASANGDHIHIEYWKV